MAVIAVAGRRIDAPGTSPVRFPLENVPGVRAQIRRRLDELHATAVVSSAANGADLIAAEYALDRSLTHHVVLPFGEDQFEQRSVSDRPGGWRQLFQRVVARARANGTLTVLARSPDDEAAYLAANCAMLDIAASQGDAPQALIVWDGKSRGQDDVTASFANDARARGMPVHEIITLVPRTATPQRYARTCFVVMPFGRKTVGDREIDFDELYDKLILPAVRAARLPDDTPLEPLRADQEFFSAAINVEMFHALEYSRIALVDITGLNANVFYELGARHRARESGTVIVRKEDASIPFDINTIRVFSYKADSEQQIAESLPVIARVLTETLREQRPDSPVQLALSIERERPELEATLAEAENQLRMGDGSRAAALLLQAVEQDADNAVLRLRAAVLLRDQGQFPDVVVQAHAAAQLAPGYAEAHRELGIAQNKLHTRTPADHADTGEAALLRAIELNARDYEALCNLGGIYKRQRRYSEALERYDAALALSNGHPYPLLNVLKLRFALDADASVDERDRLLLRRARAFRETQARQTPPVDTPWCFFDLSDIALFLGDEARLVEDLDAGIERSSDIWQIKTHADSLELLPPGLPGLGRAMTMLRAAADALRFQ